MRIIHVITRLIIGGAQENTLASVLGLRGRRDMAVKLVSGPTSGPEGTLEPLARTLGADFILVPNLVRPVRPWADSSAARALIQIFRREQPDLVHTHSGKAGFLARLAARRAGVPNIVHTVHGPSFGSFQGRVPNLLYTAAERLAARVTTHFVVVADAMRDQYLRAGVGRTEQYTRIFSGFDLDPFLSAQNDLALRQSLGLAPEHFVVGKVARLFHLKGHDDLISAAPALLKRCPQTRFLLVGDGPWRERLQERVRAGGLSEYFIFAGLVSPGAVPRYLGVMDLLVHLSRREGLARALPQALAAGRPVVAYDCDGAGEVCRDGISGYLVAPGEIGVLADQIARLCNDPERRGRFAAAGRRFVQQEFSVGSMVDRLEVLYRTLLPA